MQIVSELAAVQRRIAEITSSVNAGGAFAEIAAANGYAERTPQTAAQVPASSEEIGRIVSAAARRNNLDPALIDAIIENESGFNVRATSSAGARGLMQLMPQTAAGLGVRDAYDAGQNVDGGTRYLRALLDRFGSVRLAVAAYNAGPNAVERYGGLPPYAQTREYVERVLASYARRSQLGNPATTESSRAPDSMVP